LWDTELSVAALDVLNFTGAKMFQPLKFADVSNPEICTSTAQNLCSL